MKKISYKYINRLLLACVAVAMILLSAACEREDEILAPVITEIRNYAESPNDTLVQTLNTGQWVVVHGKNLNNVSEVYFGSIPAPINNTFFTNDNIVIQVPAIPFQSVSGDKINEITLVNAGGMAVYTINIIGEPYISYIRNYDAAPNDTICSLVSPGQHINIVGFNLKNASTIAFQGVNIDLSSVVYTDSSAIVKVPEDFSQADAALANRITYATSVGSITYSIPIFDPAVLEYYKDPLWIMLTGGLGNEKTWVIDIDADAVSKKFNGPLYFSGDGWGWENKCVVEGANCFLWEPEYQGWFPAPKDYGTMTFKLKGNPIDPELVVNQKGLSDEKNGEFSGSYFFDVDAKTITFTDVVPLNMGWELIFTKATIITLTEDGMQLGFKDPNKDEFQILNYIPK